MPDVQEVFRLATQKVQPDAGALERQHRQQRRQSGRRRAGVYALVAVIMAAIAILAAGTLNLGKEGSAPATVGPSGSRLAFTVVELDGSIRANLPRLPLGTMDPDVSPDGSTVAFSTGRGDTWQIATMRLDGTGLRVITSGPLPKMQPRWSPDGSELLFYRLLYFRSETNGNGFLRLMVMNADGTNVHRIRGPESPDSQPPDLSPDGSLILYTSVSGDQPALETVPATGGRSHRIDTARLEEGGGTWSPDGQSIAFKHRVGLGFDYQIWLMNADGSRRRLLAALPDANAEAPEWSPDGSMIAFIGSVNGIGGVGNASDAVYVVDVATGHITEVMRGIAVGLGQDSRATWMPEGDALLVMTETE